jgi:molecular chaperone HtpG
MLLDDQAHDLLPLWAGFVGGVVESNVLTPTANREDLQRDDAYFATQHALAEGLIKGLGELAKTSRLSGGVCCCVIMKRC